MKAFRFSFLAATCGAFLCFSVVWGGGVGFGCVGLLFTATK